MQRNHSTLITKIKYSNIYSQIKCLNKWSNKSLSRLELPKDLLPGKKIFYLAVGMKLRRLWTIRSRLKCNKIHACHNGWNMKNLINVLCAIYQRWKLRRDDGRCKGVHVKVLHHSLIVPRLQRFYMCEKNRNRHDMVS